MTDIVHVPKVLDILDVVWLRTNPPGLIVRACGEVPTSGWTEASLVPREYVTPPSDGIQEFDFFAKKPHGFVLQVVSKVRAEGLITELGDWVKGIRVIAEQNELEFVFPTYELLFDEREDIEGDAQFETFAVQGSDGTVGVPILPEDYTERAAFLLDGQSCRSYRVGQTSIPETKTVMEVRCIAKNPFNGKCIAKTKVPIIYRRTSKLTLFAEICVPDEKEIWNAVKDCVEQAVAVGIVASLITSGNLAAGAAALKVYLKACLKVKLGEAIDSIDVRLRRQKVPGKWKKL